MIEVPTEHYPTITDEKLENYLSIWDKLIDQGHRSRLDINLTINYDCSRFPLGPWINLLTYGEERRELTYEQAWRVKDWLDKLKERIREHAS